LFDVLAAWPEFTISSTSEGLPILSPDFESESRIDLEKSFSVSVGHGEILLFWDELGLCEACVFDRRVRYLIRAGRLCGIWFIGLSERDITLFSSHAQQSAPK